MTLSGLRDRIAKLLESVSYITSHSPDLKIKDGRLAVIFETADQRYCVTSNTVGVKNISMLPELEHNLVDYRKQLWDLRVLLYNLAAAIRVYEESIEGKSK